MRVLAASLACLMLQGTHAASQSYKFKYFASKMDWASAEVHCVDHGGHLATVSDAMDNTRAFNRCYAERCWLGFK